MDYGIMRNNEMKQCINIASEAFADYEFFSTYFPRKTRRKGFLRSMLTTEFRMNKDREIFLTAKQSNNIVAVAILCAPGYTKPSDKEYLQNGFWKALICGGYNNVVAWNEMDVSASEPCQSLGDSWYLSMLVVNPSVKGKGIGSKMLQECIVPYVKQQGGTHICLFTNSEGNRKFYQKNGFSEFNEQFFSYRGKTIGSWSYLLHL